MKQPKSILIFGAGELQVSLIKNVREMGYQAIVIDPIQDAEGRAEADVFVPLAADDYERTLKLAQDYHVSAVVTTALDNPLPMMARIARKLGLRFPTEESIQNAIDKAKFKRILQEYHLPCAKGNSFNVGELPNFSEVDYPVIVKPNKNSGSRGVVLCENKAELENAIDNVAQFCRDKRFIAEEYLKGDEISVEGVVNEGKFTLVQITDKIVSPPPYNVEMGHVQPSKYISQKEKIHSLLQRIVEVTGLNDCGIHAELKINDNGIFIIELGPRLGGDYITSHLIPLSTRTLFHDSISFCPASNKVGRQC
jgi:carbamoyl-phosphate synthase large subunit